MNHLTSIFFIAIALYSEVAIAATDCTAWQRDINDTVSQSSSPCYWQYLTANLTKAASSQVDIDKQLKTTAPELVAMIRRDALPSREYAIVPSGDVRKARFFLTWSVVVILKAGCAFRSAIRP